MGLWLWFQSQKSNGSCQWFLGLAQENGVFSILHQMTVLTCLEHTLEQ